MEIPARKMRVLSASSPSTVAETTEVLKGGGIVVYPTDTLYGLGADALNAEAVERVSQIKGRTGPWSIAVSNTKMLEQFCAIPKKHTLFVQENLPGPVTLIFPRGSEELAPALFGESGTIGVRIPDHPIATDMVRHLGRPVTSTSVNRTGEPALNNPDQIAKYFSSEVDLLLDAGTLPPSEGSTIFELTTETRKRLR
ncbi:MAG: L-threonylcarbamoyladenylate synthase [Candidatus Neomarinimicrobiota bacterium]|nr:L-threonylcarbamoyladenylate synthase [Candidatus Neomarinimicrobiota bacterium]